MFAILLFFVKKFRILGFHIKNFESSNIKYDFLWRGSEGVGALVVLGSLFWLIFVIFW